LLFLIYPGVSNTILSTYACREFDGGLRYLRKDLTLSCEDADRSLWLVLAGFGVAIYVVGIPAFYIQALWRVRKELYPKNGEAPNSQKFPHLVFLTDIYKPRFYWWEVFELVRKLIQTSVIVFIVDGSLFQTIFMMAFTMVVIVMINELKPYVSGNANRLAYVAQWEILIISFLTLLYRVDLTAFDKDVPYDKKTMLDACVIGACFIAPILALYQSRRSVLKFLRFAAHKSTGCLRSVLCCPPQKRVQVRDDEEEVVNVIAVEELGSLDRNSSRISSGTTTAREAMSFPELATRNS